MLAAAARKRGVVLPVDSVSLLSFFSGCAEGFFSFLGTTAGFLAGAAFLGRS